MHLKLFFLNGFGYAADSLILLLQSVTAGQAALEFNPSFTKGLTVAAYSGMLIGALFWGLSEYCEARALFSFLFCLVSNPLLRLVRCRRDWSPIRFQCVTVQLFDFRHRRRCIAQLVCFGRLHCVGRVRLWWKLDPGYHRISGILAW